MISWLELWRPCEMLGFYMTMLIHPDLIVTVSPGRWGCSDFLGISNTPVWICSPASFQIPGESLHSDPFSVLPLFASVNSALCTHWRRSIPSPHFFPHWGLFGSSLFSGLHKSVTLVSSFKESPEVIRDMVFRVQFRLSFKEKARAFLTKPRGFPPLDHFESVLRWLFLSFGDFGKSQLYVL